MMIEIGMKRLLPRGWKNSASLTVITGSFSEASSIVTPVSDAVLLVFISLSLSDLEDGPYLYLSLRQNCMLLLLSLRFLICFFTFSRGSYWLIFWLSKTLSRFK